MLISDAALGRGFLFNLLISVFVMAAAPRRACCRPPIPAAPLRASTVVSSSVPVARPALLHVRAVPVHRGRRRFRFLTDEGHLRPRVADWPSGNRAGAAADPDRAVRRPTPVPAQADLWSSCAVRRADAAENWYAILTMATTLASIVGVSEVMTLTQRVTNAEGRTDLLIPIYSYVLLWFFVYCYPISVWTRRLEARYAER
jgi:hypothetical protein